MRVLVCFLGALAYAAGATLDDFLMGLGGQQCSVLRSLKEQNNNVMPNDVREVLDRNGVVCPGVYPESGRADGQLSDEEWARIWASVDRAQRKKEYKAKNFRAKPLGRGGVRCTRDSDCPLQQVCMPKEKLIKQNLASHNASEMFGHVKTALQLDGDMCSDRFDNFLYQDSTKLLAHIFQAVNNIKNTLGKAGDQKGFDPFIKQMEHISNFDFQAQVAEPMARQGAAGYNGGYGGAGYGGGGYGTGGYGGGGYGGGYGGGGGGGLFGGGGDNFLTLFLIANSLDDDEDDDNDIFDTLILLSFLGQDLFSTGLGGSSGQGGFGDIFSSPFLLLFLLDDDDDSGIGGSSSLLTLLILSQSGGFGGSDQGYLLPLILLMDDDSSNDTLDFILPLLLLGGGGLGGGGGGGLFGGGGHGGGGHGGACQGGLNGGGFDTFLLFLILLGDDDDDGDVSDLLVLFLLLGDNCDPYTYQTRMGHFGGGGYGSDPFQLILLLTIFDDLDGTANIMNNTVLLFALLGGLGTGGTGGIDNPLLLLFLTGNINTSDSLALFFLADPRFAQNPLALLLLFSDDLGGGLFSNTSLGSDSLSNLLILSLLFSNGNKGLFGGQPGATITTSPYAVSYADPSIPQPGPGFGGGTQYYGQPSAPAFGGSLIGQGGGIFEYFILLSVLGDSGGTGTDTLELFIILMLTRQQQQPYAPGPQVYPPAVPYVPPYQPQPYQPPAYYNTQPQYFQQPAQSYYNPSSAGGNPGSYAFPITS